jgi:hypothetical protein
MSLGLYKIKRLRHVGKYLKSGITLGMLKKIANRYTDNEMAEKVQLARSRLFDKILAALLYISGSFLD